jgi:YidC/Oxa1 family membrane protein insertase
MLHNIWTAILYQPLVNLLAFFINVVPGGDVGLAIVILTLLVKTVLYPLSQRGIESQAKMNKLAPHLNEIKKGGASKEEQARLTFELYKKHQANPFSGCLLILIQIPIIITLYYVFRQGINFNSGVLYSFVHMPANLNMHFLGLIDITGKSIILVILAGVSQYFQAHFMSKPPVSTGSTPNFQDSFAKSMQTQTKYFFPLLIAFIAYGSGVIALYLITSNVFAIGQQLYAKKKEENFIPSTVK